MPDAAPEHDHWAWSRRMQACLRDVQPQFKASEPRVVDYELIPRFSGSPEAMVVWLLCEREEDVPALQARHDAWAEALKARMEARGFPAAAIETVEVRSVSLEAIAAGGGRFYYFR